MIKLLLIVALTKLAPTAFASFVLAPIYEGTYSVRFSCQEGKSFAFCQELENYSLSNTPLRMMVFNHTETTTFVIYDYYKRNVIFHFSAAKEGNSAYEILASSTPGFPRKTPEMILQWDTQNETGNTGSGWIRDPFFPSDVRVEIIQRMNASTIFPKPNANQRAVPLSQLVGDYDGVLDAPAGVFSVTLRIRKSGIETDRLVASAIPKNSNPFPPLELTFVSHDSESGFLTLMGNYDVLTKRTDNDEEVKYLLTGVEDHGGNVTLNGGAIYSNGDGFHRLRFKKR